MNFFLMRSGNQQGPYPLSSLPEMNKAGNILATDYIWVEGAPSWVPISNYLGPKSTTAPPPLPAASPVAAHTKGGPPPLPSSSVAADEATARLVREVEAGGRFVIFTYCISVLVLTFKRPSNIMFLRRDQDGASPAIGYSVLSGLLGWWGIPWGPIWTIAALISNARGGRDVTLEVLTEKVGPTAATAILSRRQKPAPAGWLMNSFRVALFALPALLIGIIFLGIFTGAEGSSDPPRARSAFDAANRQINVNHGEVAFGNSGRAIAVASDVSRSMKVLRELGFEGGKKDGLSVSKHEFLTYCDLREGQCIVLVHVPELRRFTADAKDSLASMAWGRTQAALRQQNAGAPGMKVVVGMRGIALYDRVMSGQFVANSEAQDNGLAATVKDGREDLKRYCDEASRMPETRLPATSLTNANRTVTP
jgi:hypothetical protein